MVSSASPKNPFEYDKEIYYGFGARSPETSVFVSQETDALSSAVTKFCPLHGQQAIFDKLVTQRFMYPCCGMKLEESETGVDLTDMGITTMDGAVHRNPIYGLSAGGSHDVIVPAATARSSRSRRQIRKTIDDSKMGRRGYNITKIDERVQSARTFQPNALAVKKDSYRWDILDRYNQKPKEVSRRKPVHGLE